MTHPHFSKSRILPSLLYLPKCHSSSDTSLKFYIFSDVLCLPLTRKLSSLWFDVFLTIYCTQIFLQLFSNTWHQISAPVGVYSIFTFLSACCCTMKHVLFLHVFPSHTTRQYHRDSMREYGIISVHTWARKPADTSLNWMWLTKWAPNPINI